MKRLGRRLVRYMCCTYKNEMRCYWYRPSKILPEVSNCTRADVQRGRQGDEREVQLTILGAETLSRVDQIWTWT